MNNYKDINDIGKRPNYGNKELPENQIVTKIHGVDREDANGELEKGELVYNPGTMTIHKVLGKSHAQGGTPVNLDEGTFIFSDFSKLSLDRDDYRQMDFSHGKKFGSKNKHTPAKVLERELAGGIKHHNEMVNIVNNPAKFDSISQKTAQLMIDKNLNKVGQVAYLQEEKKRFREGLPEISIGTAPIYSSDVAEDMIKAKQYNPYEHKNDYKMGGIYQTAGYFTPQRRFTPRTTPYDRNNLPLGYGDPQYISELMNRINSITGNNYPTNQQGLVQMRAFDAQNNADFVNDAGNTGYWNRNATTDTNYIDTLRPEYDAIAVRKRPVYFNSFDERDKYVNDNKFTYLPGSSAKGRRIDPETGRYVGETLMVKPQLTNPTLQTTNPPYAQNQLIQAPSPVPTTSVNQSTGDNSMPTQPTRYNVGLTSWQQINLAKGMADALGVKTYYPIRQQQQSVITTPDLISAQPMLDQANQAYFNAARLNRLSTNPQISTAANEQLAANRLDQNAKIVGDVQNQNVNIINQARQQNANILNQDAAANRAFDRQYYDQTVAALQNRDDLRDSKWNQVMDQANQMFAENQAFNNAINSQQQYRTAVRNSKGEIIGYRGGLPYEPTKEFFGYGFRYNPNIDTSSLLGANMGLGQAQKDDYLDRAIQMALDKGDIRSLSYLLGQRGRR